ncbi:hypothetical protein M3Y96_01015100 [Aphelenchoides besseyi]|nr:hypothetical protein M3Y96_01015100 [Aphelenchoides besseyi]
MPQNFICMRGGGSKTNTKFKNTLAIGFKIILDENMDPLFSIVHMLFMPKQMPITLVLIVPSFTEIELTKGLHIRKEEEKSGVALRVLFVG